MVTTREPGASEVFTVGRTRSPRATAFRARSPAASITDGFEVFVQEVIAAITTSPWPTSISASEAASRGPRRTFGVGRLFTISYSVRRRGVLAAPVR